ncbi:MAG: cysteine--tRNA ligase [Clostridia bacterium]|nr:cysteine--tRNA ligase [Clostridia bacterium]
MQIYNTLTRKREKFVPLKEGQVGIYACGPTVYNYIHIGNARPIVTFDVLRRYFEYRGYKVTFVQNFTDIDDKILKKAKEDNQFYREVSEKYIKEYFKDAHGLNVRDADVHPKVSDNIDAIIKMVSTLIENGHAYIAENNDVYFDTQSFDEYGKLSHQDLESLEAGARITVEEKKKNAMDFALWKAPKDDEPYFEAPFGKGRPGWHIECSAMSTEILGKTFDIHCGGRDLIFPHHENEIAQSECCYNEKFANYWMHNGYINVDGSKMSKSLGNFFTVREIAEKTGYEVIRYLMLSSHYRTPINFSKEILDQNKNSLDRLYNCKNNLEFEIKKSDGENELENYKNELEKFRQQFITAMDDDLNTADALAAIFDLTKYINTNILEKGLKRQILEDSLELFVELNDVLGFLYERREQTTIDGEEIERLIAERQKARAEKNYELADKIRDELSERGIELKDTKDGVKWAIKQ